MSQEIAVIVKDGQNVVSTNTVMEGSGATGRPLIVKAGSKQSIELKNIATGVAPDQIHVTKDGKNLKIKLGKKASDADDSSDIIIEGYYDNDASLVGVAENGQYYNFIPQGANPDSSYYSLGGDVIGTATETDWLPIALALLGAGALAALAGGGGGSHPDATPPKSLTITVADDDNPAGEVIIVSTDNPNQTVAMAAPASSNIPVTNDSTPKISGYTEAGATVTIYDGKTELGTVKADSNGKYTFPIPESKALSDGTHYIFVTATDAAGNSINESTAMFDVDTLAPKVELNPTDGSPITGTVSDLGGTTTTEIQVIITYNDGTQNVSVEVPVDNNGNFTYTPATPLPHETVITATATDAAGNESTDTVPVNSAVPDMPTVYDDVAPVIDFIVNNGSTNDTVPTIAGSGVDAGSTINVYDKDVNDNYVLLGTVNAADGSWSFEPTTPFADGSQHTITYTVNEGPHSGPVHFTIDTSAPSSVSMTLTDDVAPVTGLIANGGTTNDNKPTISGHTEAGATVTIKDGVTTLAIITADINGNYAFTPTTSLSEGAHSVNATAADAAGNSITSTTTNFTVDTLSPTAITNITTIADDTAPTGDFATSDTSLIIGGTNTTLSANEKVQISLDSGNTWVDATQNTSTTWSYDNTANAMTIGTHTLQSRVIDAAGNVGPADTQSLTIDVPAIIDLGDDGKLINPVFVDGNYYYYWDKDGDGKGMDDLNPDIGNGTIENQGDYFTHNELDAIFKYDSNGNLRPDNLHDTNDTYRYADINGYHLALPTYGGDILNDHAQLGTAIDNVPAGEINSTYDDLVAIWDAFNGGSLTTTAVPGEPHGWATGEYWSATPYTYDSTMHYRMDISNGTGGANPDSDTNWTAVQVIF